MLRVMIIKKYYDKDEKLIGYRVKNVDTGEEVDASKDAVKNMAVRGELDILNMTLTSDGRLIGRATTKLAPAKKSPEKPVGTGRKATRIYTNGRKIACILVDENLWLNRIGVTAKTPYKGIETGFNFDVGFEATEKIKRNEYDNIKVVDGKMILAPEVKKQSYKNIKEKLMKTLLANDIHTTLRVDKGDNKYEYAIVIENYDNFADLDPMVQILRVLIENCLSEYRTVPLYIDEDTIYVRCLTGITDVRKALKENGLNKF